MRLTAFNPARAAAVREHYGPGPHQNTGTPQLVHAGGRVGRRARAWGELFKVGAATWDGDATNAAIRRRKGYGATERDPELARMSDHDLRTFARGGSENAPRAYKEARRRGWDRATSRPRGQSFGAMAKLSGPSVKRAQVLRTQKLSEAEAWVRQAAAYERRGFGRLMGGVTARDLRGALRYMVKDEKRSAWWLRHADTPGDQLLELTFSRGRLNYQRETANIRRYAGVR